MSRFHEIELEKAFDGISSADNLRIQLGIFFTTANLGTLSFALTQEKSGILFFAAIIFLIMLVIDMGIRELVTHYYYRVARIQHLYAPDDDELAINFFSKLATLTTEIARITDKEKRLDTLRKLPKQRRNPFGFWLPFLACTIEIVSGLTLWLVFGWSLF